jgi:hypothetical protein
MADQSTGVIVWWVCLAAVAVVNVAVWATVAMRAVRDRGRGDPRDRTLRRRQLLLSAMFVFGCAFRSFLPRVEGSRFCLYDSWISNAALARAVATVAELALVAQWSLVLARWAKEDRATMVAVIARILVPLIAIAEVCSWYTALTTDYVGSVVEESIWAATATLMTLALVWLFPRSSGARRRFIGIAVVLNAAYVVFMCTVDVPMYALRWRRDQARDAQYLGVADGWRDSWQRWVVTRRWADWREEIPWMTLYFSAGVWISISLVRAPLRALATDEVDEPARLEAAGG